MNAPIEDDGCRAVLDFVELNVGLDEVQHLLLVSEQQPTPDPALEGHTETD